MFAAIDIARRNGVKVAYDTNYRPRLWPPARAAAVMHAAMAQTDYALPGIEDVRMLTGLTDPDAMLDFYLRLGPKVVVLKMGEAGAYLATPDRRVRIPKHDVQVVDATGAGDTFCGSFLARILAGDAPEQAARYASVAAALKCTGYGAVAPIPRAADVLAACVDPSEGGTSCVSNASFPPRRGISAPRSARRLRRRALAGRGRPRAAKHDQRRRGLAPLDGRQRPLRRQPARMCATSPPAARRGSPRIDRSPRS